LEGGSDPMKIQVRVGPSRIAGQGLFAAEDIKKGTRIMQYIGEKISSRERARRLAAGNVYIFHLTYRYAIDGQTLEIRPVTSIIRVTRTVKSRKRLTPSGLSPCGILLLGRNWRTTMAMMLAIIKRIRAIVVPQTAVGISWLKSIGG
jgi:hypothetical protein